MVFVKATPALLKLLEEHGKSTEKEAIEEDLRAIDEMKSSYSGVPFVAACDVSILRSISKETKLPVRSLIKMCGGELLVAPPTLPSNPDRKEMRERVRKIDVLVENEKYMSMVGGVQGTYSAAADKLRSSRTGSIESNSSKQRGGKESYRSFMQDVAVALDMRLMALAGGVVGYYLGYIRGMSREECIVGATVGVVLMMMVDALLLIIRISKQDAKEKRMKKITK